jgi:tRNA threonylcarbamoyladenosine biosynthesis protein TsaE
VSVRRPRHARRWITRAAAETERLGAELAPELGPDGVLLLTGELGTGKTVLARGVAAALGIDPRQVLSPSFNLIREHRGAPGRPPRLVHVDLYRLEPQEAAALGLDEVLAGAGVKVVEWAERLPAAPPAGPATLALHLRRLPGGEGGKREIVEVVEIVSEELETPAPPQADGPRRPPGPQERARLLRALAQVGRLRGITL